MVRERLKVVKLGAELVKYFIANQIFNMHVDFDFGESSCSITISGSASRKPDDFDQLAAALRVPRQPEIDEYYEQLINIDSVKQEFYIIGAMVDESEASYEQGCLQIRIVRFKRAPFE